MGRANPSYLKTERLVFLNIGAAPSNPMLPHEIVMELRENFVLQNTIHWIKSIAIAERHCSRRPAGDARFAQRSGYSGSHARPFQTDQLEAIPERLPRIHFFISRSTARSTSTGSRSAFRIRTKATLRAGRTRVAAIAVAAATPGLFPMKRSSAAIKSGRIPRHFPSRSPRIASSSTAARASRRCSIPFSASEIPPSPRRDAA